MVLIRLEVNSSVLTTVGLSWYLSFLYPQVRIVRLCISSLSLGGMCVEMLVLD